MQDSRCGTVSVRHNHEVRTEKGCGYIVRAQLEEEGDPERVILFSPVLMSM